MIGSVVDVSHCEAGDLEGLDPMTNDKLTLVEVLAEQKRLGCVDMLRGLVMVIMALDHVRWFFTNAYSFDPTDLTRTTASLFFTRWITHFCAPVFVLLAGTGSFLSASRGRTKKNLAGFLLSRGLWIVLIDFFLVHTFGWWFNVDYHLIYGDVLWAVGCSMVVMAALIFLPTRFIAAMAVATVMFHNMLDSIRVGSSGSFHWLWAIVHSGEPLEPFPGIHFVPGYPLVPWIGVMAGGYAFGKLLVRQQDKRGRELLRLGIGLTLAFVVIRAANLYGDPRAWSAQKT